MKRFALAMVLAACQGKATPAAVGSGSVGSAVAAPSEPDVCVLGKEAVTALALCNGQPVVDSIKKGGKQVTGVIDMMAAKGASGIDAQMTCAQMLRTFDDDLVKVGCRLPLSEAARTRMYDLVDRWNAVRTPVVATGNAAADAKIAHIAAVRDEGCKCTTDLCMEGVQKEVDEVGAFGSDAPQAAIELGGRLLDDIAKCNAVRTNPLKRQ